MDKLFIFSMDWLILGGAESLQAVPLVQQGPGGQSIRRQKMKGMVRARGRRGLLESARPGS